MEDSQIQISSRNSVLHFMSAFMHSYVHFMSFWADILIHPLPQIVN